MKMPWASKTIDMKHIPPKIPVASTLMWLTMAHYWAIPQWGWVILFVVIGIVWSNWIMWFFGHRPINFGVGVVESRDRPRTEVMRWAKHPTE